MNTETTIKEQEVMDQEKSINDFFIEEVERVNEGLREQKEELKLMSGFICSSELSRMVVSRNRSIRDNIKNAMAIAGNNIMASVYAQTKTAKNEIELKETKKKCRELEDKIKSQTDTCVQLDEFIDDGGDIYLLMSRVPNLMEGAITLLNELAEEKEELYPIREMIEVCSEIINGDAIKSLFWKIWDKQRGIHE